MNNLRGNFMKAMLLSLLLPFSLYCCAKNNSEGFEFQGYWKVNNDLTLNEISKNSVPNKQKWISCYEKLLCGNFIYQFHKNKFYILFSTDSDYQRASAVLYELEHKSNLILLNYVTSNGLNSIEFELINENRMRVKLDNFYEVYDRVQGDLGKKIIDYKD